MRIEAFSCRCHCGPIGESTARVLVVGRETDDSVQVAQPLQSPTSFTLLHPPVTITSVSNLHLQSDLSGVTASANPPLLQSTADNSASPASLTVTIPPGSSSPGLMVGQAMNSEGPSPSNDENIPKGGEAGDNEAEGVWSPDIEQSFHEALAIYPPCGRRKIILSDEGKMYGRNELIARYIKLRTGKTRTRKQVSSHIQVLARRKSREMQSQFKDQATKDKVLQSMASMSSAQIVSAGVLQNSHMDINQGMRPAYNKPTLWSGLVTQPDPDIKPFNNSAAFVGLPGQSGMGLVGGAMPGPNVGASRVGPVIPATSTGFDQHPAIVGLPWENRQIANKKLRLIDFSAFLEQQAAEMDNYSKHLFVHINQSNPSYSDPVLESVDIRQIYDKFPESKGGLRDLFEKGPKDAFFLVKFWADLNVNVTDDSGGFYGVTSQFESRENMTITCSTKVCSFGKQVVEKVETEYPRFENDHFSYRIHRSPMCEYMINFILKLKHLPEKYMMNSVLENFTILQVITNRDTQETLLCLAFVFEVSTSEHGAQHHMYKLVND